jgi:uncharacterized protein YjdB
MGDLRGYYSNMKHLKIISLLVFVVFMCFSIFSCYPPGLGLDLPDIPPEEEEPDPPPVDPPPVDPPEPPPVEPDPIWNLELDQEGFVIMEADKAALTVTATVTENGEPVTIANDVTWESSNPKFADVVDGVVTAISPGVATITAISAAANKSAQFTASVKSLEISCPTDLDGEINISYGQNLELVAVLNPDHMHQDSGVTWNVLEGDAKFVNPTEGSLSLNSLDALGTVKVHAEVSNAETGEKTFSATKDIVITKAETGFINITHDGTGKTQVNESYQLYAEVRNSNGAKIDPQPQVEWTSNSDSVTITSDGLVTGDKVGDPVITASSFDDKSIPISKTFTLHVRDLRIDLPENAVGVSEKTPLQLTAVQINPDGEQAMNANWNFKESTDSEFAEINNGLLSLKVTPPSTLESITVTSNIDGTNLAAEKTIPVIHPPVVIINDNKESAKLMAVGKEYQLTAKVERDGNELDTDVTWKSDQSGIATVSNGLITAKGAGTTVITASVTDEFNQTATETFTANVRALDILLPSDEIANAANITRGEEVLLSAVLIPYNEKVKAEWTIKNGDTANDKIDANGILTTSSSASGTITVQASYVIDGITITAEETITRIPPPASTVNINLENSSTVANSRTVKVGSEIPLTATVLDSSNLEITGAAVTWASDYPNVATVSSANGKTTTVTAIADGDAKITASTINEKTGTAITKIFTVHVKHLEIIVPPDDTPNVNDISKGEQIELTAALMPEHDHVTVVWTVTEDGTVTTSSTPTEGFILTTIERTEKVEAIKVEASVIVDETEFTAEEIFDRIQPPAGIINIFDGNSSTVTNSRTVKKGDTINLSAEVLGEDGETPIDNATISWLSDIPSIATVSSSSGLEITVTAKTLGDAHITASIENGTETITKGFTVHVRDLEIIVPADDTPDIADISRVKELQLTAVLTDGVDAHQHVDATWTIKTGAAEDFIDPSTGILKTTSTIAGTITVEATVIFDGTTFTTTTDISRVLPPASIINIEWKDIPPDVPDPNRVYAQGPRQLMAGETIQLNAIVQDSSAAPIDGAKVTWSSSKSSVATVVPETGLVTAVGAGDVTITATSGNIPKTYTIEVRELTLDPEGDQSFLVAVVEVLGVRVQVGTPPDIDAFISDGEDETPLSNVQWLLTDEALNLLSDGLVIAEDGKMALSGVLSIGNIIVTATIPNTNITATKKVFALGLGVQ